MKLQRNNKYVNKLTKGLSTLLLVSTILTGVNVNAYANEENIKNPFYYLNFYRISDNERNDRLTKLDIKFPEAIHVMDNIDTLVVNDNGTYKVMPVIRVYDNFKEKMEVYDLFTEEKLFELPETIEVYNNVKLNNYSQKVGHDFSKIENAIPYFSNKEIVDYGSCTYLTLFFEKNMKEFSKRDSIDYQFNRFMLLSYLYEANVNPLRSQYSTQRLADNYVTTVPIENQVTSEELGLKASSHDEDKYFDFWKYNEQNLEQNLEDFEVVFPDAVLSGAGVQTLVFKDNEGNYKLMNVLMNIQNNKMYLYDLFSNTELFNVNMIADLEYKMDNNFVHQYTGIDFSTVYDAIPYFNDKQIIKLDTCTEINNFVYENIVEFSNKDKINYKYPEGSYFYYNFPYDFEYNDDIVMTEEEYAKNYLVNVPTEMQVYSKDLKLGLDNVKTK